MRILQYFPFCSSHAMKSNVKITYMDGSIYHGSVLRGKPHGEGTMTRYNGDSYLVVWID